MITTGQATREVTDWNYVINLKGKVSSVAYSYNHVGNEVWESYFMGRPFMMSGDKIEFFDPELNAMLATDVQNIEAIIDLERKRESDPGQPVPSMDGCIIKKNPLEAGLAEFGITLQKTDVPQRIKGKQYVLFLGNVLNHYPVEVQTRELGRIVANMHSGDIIIIQAVQMERPYIEVFYVKEQGARKSPERVRWINTSKLEVHYPDHRPDSWRQVHLKPVLDRIRSHLIDCLGRKEISPDWSLEKHQIIVNQYINLVFATFFRALPVEKTLRIAIREALRRLPSYLGPKGFPVFRDDEKDARGGALGLNPEPIVSDADLIKMMMASANVERTLVDNTNRRNEKTLKI
jgi:hypothetical protein